MGMKRRVILIFRIELLLFLLTSLLITFSVVAETQGIFSVKKSSTYCDILEVSQEPTLASPPKSYLGIYLESQILKYVLPGYLDQQRR
jgi:hypothetical protein